MEWKLAEAKNKLSELVTRATTEGPQTIHRLGDTVVMISEADYLKLTGDVISLGKFLTTGPKVDLKLKRDRSTMRDAGL